MSLGSIKDVIIIVNEFCLHSVRKIEEAEEEEKDEDGNIKRFYVTTKLKLNK